VITARLGVNVLAIDYRGFGDSEGVPSQVGLVKDARAGWDWLTSEMGAAGGDVVFLGQSLGTGVASQLAVELAAESMSVILQFLGKFADCSVFCAL